MKKSMLLFIAFMFIGIIIKAQDIAFKIKASNGLYPAAFIDFNNDGKIDLLLRDYPTGNLYFYQNNGASYELINTLVVASYTNFRYGKYYNTFEQFYSDIDNDGNKDLVLFSANHQNCSSNAVRVYWGQSDSPYFANANYTNLSINSAFCVGAYAVDFDSDGLKDIFIQSASGTNTMHKNNGSRSFSQVTTYNTGRDIAVQFFDYDGDTFPDLCYTKNGWADGQWGLRFNKGLGNGNFNSSTIVNYVLQRPFDEFLLFNTDPLLNTNRNIVFNCAYDELHGSKIYIGEWDISKSNFTFTNFTVGNNTETTIIQAIDYNYDGYEDIITRYRTGTNPYYYTTVANLNDGSGNFSDTDTIMKNKPYSSIELSKSSNGDINLIAYGNPDSIYVFNLKKSSANYRLQVINEIDLPNSVEQYSLHNISIQINNTGVGLFNSKLHLRIKPSGTNEWELLKAISEKVEANSSKIISFSDIAITQNAGEYDISVFFENNNGAIQVVKGEPLIYTVKKITITPSQNITINILKLEPDINPSIHNVNELATVHQYYQIKDSEGNAVPAIIIEYELLGLEKTFYSSPSDATGIVDIAFPVWGADIENKEDDYIKEYNAQKIRYKGIKDGGNITVNTNHFIEANIAVYPFDSNEKTYGFILSGKLSGDVIYGTEQKENHLKGTLLGLGAVISFTNQFENDQLSGMKYSFTADAKQSVSKGLDFSGSPIPSLKGTAGYEYGYTINPKYSFTETLPTSAWSYLKIWYDLGSSIWNLSRTDDNLHYTLNAVGSFLGLDNESKTTTTGCISNIITISGKVGGEVKFANNSASIGFGGVDNFGFNAGNISSFDGGSLEMINTNFVSGYFDGALSMNIGFDLEKTGYGGEVELSLSKGITLKNNYLANSSFLKGGNILLTSGGALSLDAFKRTIGETTSDNSTTEDIKSIGAVISKEYSHNIEFSKELLTALKNDVNNGKLNNPLSDYLTMQPMTKDILTLGYGFENPMTNLTDYLFNTSDYQQTNASILDDMTCTIDKNYQITGTYGQQFGLEIGKLGSIGALYKIGVFLESNYPVKKQVYHFKTNRVYTTDEYVDIDKLGYLFSPLNPISDLWNNISNSVKEFTPQILAKAKEFVNNIAATVSNTAISLVNSVRNYSQNLKSYNSLKSARQEDFSTIQFDIPGDELAFNQNTNITLDYYYPGGEVLGLTTSNDTIVIISDIFYLNAYYNSDTLRVAPNGDFTINAYAGQDDLTFLGMNTNVPIGLYFKGENETEWLLLGSIANPIKFNKLGTFALGVGITVDNIKPTIEIGTPLNNIVNASFTDNVGINWKSISVFANGIPVSYKRNDITNTISIDCNSLTSQEATISIYVMDLSNNAANVTSNISIVTSAEQISKADYHVSIYPVPNNGQFFIELGNQNNLIKQIEILTLTGQTVYKQTVNQTYYRGAISLINKAKGVYIIKVSGENFSQTKKIIVE